MIEIIPNWHPFLVHFTIALLSTSVVLFILTNFITTPKLKEQLLTVAKWNLWIGVTFSIATGGAGLYAYNTVAHDTESHIAMTDHRNWAVATLIVFFGIGMWSVLSKILSEGIPILFLIACLIGLSLLLTTGYKGAEVVYRYGLGVMSLPKAEGDGHAHEHVEGESHGHKQSIDTDFQLESHVERSEQMKKQEMDIKDHHDDGHDHTH